MTMPRNLVAWATSCCSAAIWAGFIGRIDSLRGVPWASGTITGSISPGLLQEVLEALEDAGDIFLPERQAGGADPPLRHRHLVEPLGGGRRGVALLLRPVEEEQALDALLEVLAVVDGGVGRVGGVDVLDVVGGAGPDRIGVAAFKAVLDIGEAVVRPGDGRLQDLVEVADFARRDLVEVAELGQALDHDADAPRPFRRRVEAADHQGQEPAPRQTTGSPISLSARR